MFTFSNMFSKNILLGSSLLIGYAAASGCVDAYVQCGGEGYNGLTTCCEVNGVPHVCQGTQWYMNCHPSSGQATPTPPPVPNTNGDPTPDPTAMPTQPPTLEPSVEYGGTCAALYAQCGGRDWTGARVCCDDHVCAVTSEWYSGCQLATNHPPTTQEPTREPTPQSTANHPTVPTQHPTNAPTPDPTQAPTGAPVTGRPTPTVTVPTPTVEVTSSDDYIQALVDDLKTADSSTVFQYELPTGQWATSDLYKWDDMILAVKSMAEQGVGDAKLWIAGVGDGIAGMAEDLRIKYAKVNIAAFLSQAMQESIRYNACDENNWSDPAVVAGHGGSSYSATSACGQLHQSYQDYKCTAEENHAAFNDGTGRGEMACPMVPTMKMRAFTQAKWYGAPAKLFCAPKTDLPFAPRWDYKAPWCAQPGGYDHVAPFPEGDQFDFGEYLEYVKNGGGCKDYVGIKTGGWTFTGEGCYDGKCPGSAAPNFDQPEGRTDVEGCCWWGRGAIQTTGTCNFGKLNFYMGKRAVERGAQSLFPEIDFCANPNAICDPSSPKELKWIAGFFYWLNAVQTYESGGWNYIEKLMNWVDEGMNLNDFNFIDGASGIVNRGCHNPDCGTGALHAAPERRANFKRVLEAMGLK